MKTHTRSDTSTARAFKAWSGRRERRGDRTFSPKLAKKAVTLRTSYPELARGGIDGASRRPFGTQKRRQHQVAELSLLPGCFIGSWISRERT